MTRFFKNFLRILSFSIILFFIAAAALPSLASTPWGTKFLVDWINTHTDKRLVVDQLRLSWIKSQTIRNFKLEDTKKGLIFSCHSFDTDTSLLYLLFGGRALNKTVIKEPYLVLTKTEKDIEKEKKEKKSKKKMHGCPTFDEALTVTRGTVVFRTENVAPITVSEIQVNKDASHLTMQASTVQGNIVGSLRVDANLNQKIDAQVLIHDFPVAILDNVAHSDLYTEIIGPSLSLELNLEKAKNKALSIKGSAQSVNLNAFIDGVTEKDHFIIRPKTHLELTVTPPLFKQIIDEKKRGDWELASKTDLAIQVEKAAFPIGKKFEVKDLLLQAKAFVSRAELHHKTVGSYSIKQFEALVSKDKNLQLTYQGEIQGKEATKLSGSVAVTPTGDYLFDYVCDSLPVTLLELLSLELSQKVKLVFGNQVNMQGSGTLIAGKLNSNMALNSADTEVNGKIEGELPELNFDLSGTRTLYGNKTKILGNLLNFALKGVAKLKGRSFSIPLLQGNIFNPHLECDLRGRLGDEGEAFSVRQLDLVAMGNIKQLPLEENLSVKALQNGTFFLQVDGSKNLITGKAESQALDATFEMKDFIHDEELCFEEANILFSCNLEDFPIDAASPFVGEDLDLKNLFGKTVSLTSKGSYLPSQDPCLTLDVAAQGVGFSSSVNLSIDKTLIIGQNKPSYIYWEITPERYKTLMHLFNVRSYSNPPFILTHPTQVEFNIRQFTCPTTSSKNLGHFLCQSGFIGDLKIGTTSLRNQKTNETIAFQDITGSVKGQNFSKEIDLSLSGNILAANIPKSEKSSFSFAGQMFNLWSQTGKLNREQLRVKGELNLHLLPVRQISEMVPLDHETRVITQAVLGDFVNAHLSGEISQLTGPITIDLKSSNFKAKLPLQLQKNAIYLRDYVDAEISLTEAVNETLLKDINPLLITGAFSEHPLKVYIDPEGFVLPIRPYSLENVQIDKAIFDIGKIRVRNGGQIQALMEFLNAKEITPDGLMKAWFTPIYMSLHHGVASYKRFDALLAGNVHIALWGSINLLSDQVKMTLAIAPTTLYQRFKISGLTKKDMFQVQMQGTTDKLELDWSAAYSRIAGIVARSRLGSLVGGLVELLIGTTEELPAPPPTTLPLPWENQYPSEPEQSLAQESHMYKKTSKLLKHLLP